MRERRGAAHRTLAASAARPPYQLLPKPGVDDRALVELVALPAGQAPEVFAQLVDPLGDPDAAHLGHHTSSPNLPTTTVNSKQIGIRLDSFDHLGYQHKHLGRRRLCFNIGPGIRNLLLGELDIPTIARAVRIDYDYNHLHTDNLCAFIATSRTMRYLRIRPESGEDYTTPTELLPHDGSTLSDSVLGRRGRRRSSGSASGSRSSKKRGTAHA